MSINWYNNSTNCCVFLSFIDSSVHHSLPGGTHYTSRIRLTINRSDEVAFRLIKWDIHDLHDAVQQPVYNLKARRLIVVYRTQPSHVPATNI